MRTMRAPYTAVQQPRWLEVGGMNTHASTLAAWLRSHGICQIAVELQPTVWKPNAVQRPAP